MLKMVKFKIPFKCWKDLDRLLDKVDYGDCTIHHPVDGECTCEILDISSEDFLLLLHDVCEYRMEPVLTYME